MNSVVSFQQTQTTRIKRKITHIFIYAFLSLWALTTLFPLIWVVNNSFKLSGQILNDSFSLVKDPVITNYITAFTRQNILNAYLNSLIISGSTVALVIFFSGLASYVMTRYSFKLKPLIYAMLTGSILFPAFATIVPVFRMILKLDLVNRHLGVVIPQTAGNIPFAIIVLMGFMGNLPISLEESAYLEGCSTFGIFRKIIVPISKPAFATVAIFTFLWSYNDLFLQIIVLRRRETFPISSLLNEISSQFGTDYGLMASGVTLVVIPVLLVYLLLQKNIVKGLTAGAVKG